MWYGFYCRLNLHVWATNREVIVATRAKFLPNTRRDRHNRKDRHDVYRAVLAEHAKARELFNHVMTGG